MAGFTTDGRFEPDLTTGIELPKYTKLYDLFRNNFIRKEGEQKYNEIKWSNLQIALDLGKRTFTLKSKPEEQQDKEIKYKLPEEGITYTYEAPLLANVPSGSNFPAEITIYQKDISAFLSHLSFVGGDIYPVATFEKDGVTNTHFENSSNADRLNGNAIPTNELRFYDAESLPVGAKLTFQLAGSAYFYANDAVITDNSRGDFGGNNPSAIVICPDRADKGFTLTVLADPAAAVVDLGLSSGTFSPATSDLTTASAPTMNDDRRSLLSNDV